MTRMLQESFMFNQEARLPQVFLELLLPPASTINAQ